MWHVCILLSQACILDLISIVHNPSRMPSGTFAMFI